MRTATVNYEVYQYNELTDEAKEVFYKAFETPENVESEVIPNESELEGEI